MGVPTLDEHAQAWTEEEFLALPETVWPRLELLDGALLVSPAPRKSHQRCALANAMDAAAPVGWEVLEGINVRLTTGRILTPDLVVVREIGEGVVTDAADVALVAEIVSPSTGSQDRLLKPALYVTAGIRATSESSSNPSRSCTSPHWRQVNTSSTELPVPASCSTCPRPSPPP